MTLLSTGRWLVLASRSTRTCSSLWPSTTACGWSGTRLWSTTCPSSWRTGYAGQNPFSIVNEHFLWPNPVIPVRLQQPSLETISRHLLETVYQINNSIIVIKCLKFSNKPIFYRIRLVVWEPRFDSSYIIYIVYYSKVGRVLKPALLSDIGLRNE